MGKIFRKSLIGFNRNQVIAYIDAVLERHNTVMAAEKDKFKQLSEENQELKERLAAIEQEQAQAQSATRAEVQRLEENTAQLAGENSRLQKELENTTQSLEHKSAEYATRLRAAQSAIKEANTLRNECEQLRQHINTMEKRRTVVVAKPAEKPDAVETEEITQKTQELWANLKVKIQGLSQEFSQLTADMKATESSQEKTTKVYSIQEILDRIKKIGEKL